MDHSAAFWLDIDIGAIAEGKSIPAERVGEEMDLGDNTVVMPRIVQIVDDDKIPSGWRKRIVNVQLPANTLNPAGERGRTMLRHQIMKTNGDARILSGDKARSI